MDSLMIIGTVQILAGSIAVAGALLALATTQRAARGLRLARVPCRGAVCGRSR